MALHISLAAEKVFDLGVFPISNSMLTGWVASILLIILAFVVRSKLSSRPGGLQVLVEGLIGGLHSLYQGILGDKVKVFFPLLATLFLFIIVNNWLGLLPGVGTIGFTHTEAPHAEAEAQPREEVVTTDTHETVVPETHEETETPYAVVEGEKAPEEPAHETFVPLFRAATADLNTTLALALIAVLSLQYYGVKYLGLGAHLKKYFNFSNPILTFVGLLELIGEFSRVISFAFRLFGNIFAGEVLLAVIAFLVPVLVPIPFLGMELFVGFIQALVFTMLTSVFLNLSISHAEH